MNIRDQHIATLAAKLTVSVTLGVQHPGETSAPVARCIRGATDAATEAARVAAARYLVEQAEAEAAAKVKP